MLTEKELMIGDWVMNENNPYQIRQLGIFGVDRDGEDYPAVCIGKPKGVGLIVERNEIAPILLTPEILEKNGFKHWITEEGDDSFDYTEGNLGYCLNRTTDGYMSCIDVTNSFTITGLIKYVHELQHILRLCGMNDLADNFKI